MQAGLMKKSVEHRICTLFRGAHVRLNHNKDLWEQTYDAELLSGDGRVLAKFQVSGSLYDTWVGFSYNGDDYDMNIYNGRIFLNIDEDFVASIYPVYDGDTDTSVVVGPIHVEVI